MTDNVNSLKIRMQNIQKIRNTMRRPNVGITEVKESKENQVKKITKNIFFYNLIEDNLLNLKREMSLKVQESYKTMNKQKIISPNI